MRPNLLKLPSFSRGLSRNFMPSTLITLRRAPKIVKSKKVRPITSGPPRLKTAQNTRSPRKRRPMIEEMKNIKPSTYDHSYRMLYLSP